MAEGISPELVERMVALVRDLRADHLTYDMHDRAQDFVARTAAIVAELPAPVDPDLIEARKLAAEAVFYGQVHSDTGGRDWTEFRDGGCDGGEIVSGILAAIKRGRERERVA